MNTKCGPVRRGGGFTLIELLVVIAIIGLLASIVFAGLGGARSRGRIAGAQGNLRNLFTGLLLCSDAGGTAQIPASDTQDGGAGNLCSNTAITAAKYVSLPVGWTYCDGTASGTCGTDVSAAAPLKLTGKGDSKTVTCTEDGCVTN